MFLHLGLRQQSRHAGRSCVARLFFHEQLRDAAVRQCVRVSDSCGTQLARCVARLRGCGTHLFLGPHISNSCVAQLWGGVARVLRYGPMSTVSIRLFLTPWDCEAWRTYPGLEVAELHTRLRLLIRGYWADRYFLGERVFDTPIAPSQRRVPYAPPRHMCLLEGLTREDLEVEYRGFSANDFLSAGYFPSYFASRMQPRLPEILEYIQSKQINFLDNPFFMAFRSQVSSFVQSISDDLWQIPPMDQLAWLRISRQYGMIQRVPRIHNFESGLITSHLLTSLADRWRNRNTAYLDKGTMQDAVTPAYVNWFFTPQ
ncbi:hypothetical protein JCGZ_15386 [Jatropha curcas]|uniref:Aminotransferase-like plant mobile domain-containing protein n=1 Tax=Jatropha curcas TaxID=180498 RepID=A0A067KI63_JATCU|nr:hypothetical protein JCGZ_15386 [Jatropha curcas]